MSLNTKKYQKSYVVENPNSTKADGAVLENALSNVKKGCASAKVDNPLAIKPNLSGPVEKTEPLKQELTEINDVNSHEALSDSGSEDGDLDFGNSDLDSGLHMDKK